MRRAAAAGAGARPPAGWWPLPEVRWRPRDPVRAATSPAAAPACWPSAATSAKCPSRVLSVTRSHPAGRLQAAFLYTPRAPGDGQMHSPRLP